MPLGRSARLWSACGCGSRWLWVTPIALCATEWRIATATMPGFHRLVATAQSATTATTACGCCSLPDCRQLGSTPKSKNLVFSHPAQKTEVLLKIVVVLAQGRAPLMSGLAIGGCLDLLPWTSPWPPACGWGPWPKQPPTANMLWLSTESKVLTKKSTGQLWGGRLAVLAHCRWSLLRGLGPYCHSHGCGGSGQWACRLEYDRLLHCLSVGVKRRTPGLFSEECLASALLVHIHAGDFPVATGNSVPYFAERGFCTGTTVWPHRFSFLGCICPIELPGTWRQLLSQCNVALWGVWCLCGTRCLAWTMQAVWSFWVSYSLWTSIACCIFINRIGI